jgi:hypothetical protein
MIQQIKGRAQKSSRHDVWGGCFILDPPVLIVQIDTSLDVLVDMVDEIGELVHIAGEEDVKWHRASSRYFRLD